MACYGACLKWLLPELSFSDRWSRGTKIWERDWSRDWFISWRDVNYLRSNNRREPTLFPGTVGSWKRDWERTSLTYNSLTTLLSRGRNPILCDIEKSIVDKPASGLSTVHSGDHGPAFTYPRFSLQKVIPPSPTRTSPAFRRSKTEPDRKSVV